MLESLKQEVTNAMTSVVQQLPDILGALVMLFLGWLLARFLRMAVIHLIRVLNTLFAGRFSGTILEFARIPSAAQALLGVVVFWATLFVFATVAVRLTGFTAVASWLEQLVVYLPSLIAGGLIIILGVIMGSAMRKVVIHAAAAADISQPQFLGQVTQASLIIVSLVIGLAQMGIDVTFLTLLFGIILGTLLTGFALAFGLGARPLVENLIANQHLKQSIKLGEQVSCGSLHGRVLEFTATGVLLETSHGRAMLPAKLYMEQSFSVSHHDLADELSSELSEELGDELSGGARHETEIKSRENKGVGDES
jgi:Mechanosensitive ion channel, conserved TM helix